MLARESLILAPFTNPEAKMSVCISLLLARGSGHILVGYFFAIGSRCWVPQQLGQNTCTQTFSEAQSEKEVCKELCSSWIYLPRTDVLGWACLAQIKTVGIYCCWPFALPSAAGVQCEIRAPKQSFHQKKSLPTPQVSV